jgi:hypothetical protein
MNSRPDETCLKQEEEHFLTLTLDLPGTLAIIGNLQPTGEQGRAPWSSRPHREPGPLDPGELPPGLRERATRRYHSFGW